MFTLPVPTRSPERAAADARREAAVRLAFPVDPLAERAAAERDRFIDSHTRRVMAEQALWAGREELAVRKAREEMERCAGREELSVRRAREERERFRERSRVGVPAEALRVH